MFDRSFRRWMLVVALLGVTLDQASKYGVFRWLYQHPTAYDARERKGNFVLIPSAFQLHTQYVGPQAEGALRAWNSLELPHVNKGALFGMGNEGARLFGQTIRMDPDQSNKAFTIVSLIAAAGIVVWTFRKQTAKDRLLCLALGLILGGTIGNLYDRIVFGGVRDFLYWNKWIDWPVFNIADCCLVVGAIGLLFQAFLTNPAPKPTTAAVPDASDASALPSPAVASMS